MSYGKPRQTTETITLIGRDEMNLVEFPFGPVTSNSSKTFEVDHIVYDKQLKREVNRKLLIQVRWHLDCRSRLMIKC